MKKTTFTLFENYMRSCMEDSAHDREHVYRVLYHALAIAETEESVDYDVLICACLLHDIGRKEQFEDPSLCHAAVGGEKAHRFLIGHGFSEEFAERVRACIQTHRYRRSNPPQSLEAQILFDADKIEATGTVGIARTLFYKGQVSEPLYSLTADGQVSDGENDTQPSFFQEYKYKLENVYSHFYTKRGSEIASQRQAAARAFYQSLFREVDGAYREGRSRLKEIMEREEENEDRI